MNTKHTPFVGTFEDALRAVAGVRIGSLGAKGIPLKDAAYIVERESRAAILKARGE